MPADVVREVKNLVDDGCRDITLLGQNVNSYGKGDVYKRQAEPSPRSRPFLFLLQQFFQVFPGKGRLAVRDLLRRAAAHHRAAAVAALRAQAADLIRRLDEDVYKRQHREPVNG